jgi:hypothetical protein
MTWIRRQQGPPKRWYPLTSLHDSEPRKTWTDDSTLQVLPSNVGSYSARQEVPSVYEIWRFITVFTESRLWTQFNPAHVTPFSEIHSNIILPTTPTFPQVVSSLEVWKYVQDATSAVYPESMRRNRYYTGISEYHSLKYFCPSLYVTTCL